MVCKARRFPTIATKGMALTCRTLAWRPQPLLPVCGSPLSGLPSLLRGAVGWHGIPPLAPVERKAAPTQRGSRPPPGKNTYLIIDVFFGTNIMAVKVTSVLDKRVSLLVGPPGWGSLPEPGWGHLPTPCRQCGWSSHTGAWPGWEAACWIAGTGTTHPGHHPPLAVGPLVAGSWSSPTWQPGGVTG